MGPEASPRLEMAIRRVEVVNEVNLTHNDGIHGEILARQS